MTKQQKTLLGLEPRIVFALGAFILCGAGAAIALHKPAQGVRPDERPFPTFDAKEVDHLEITSGGKSSTFQKTGDTWRMVSPVADKADPQSLTSFVSRLATLRFEGIVADKATSQASYEVTADKGAHVVAKKGATLLADFYLGKQDGRNSYLRPANGEAIYAVDGVARYDVQKDPNGWRDHTIFPLFKSEDVTTLAIATPAGTTVVKKAAPASQGAAPVPAYQATWNVESSPVKEMLQTIDTSIAPGIAGSLAGLHASDLADGVTPAQAGLQPPQGSVTLTMQDGKKYVLEVGNVKGDDRYVATPDDSRIFLVAKTTLERVYVTPQQFRPKDMADVKADQLVGLDLTSGGLETVLARDASGWKATKPANLTIDATKVSGVVGALDNLKASMFADESDPQVTGLDKPTTVAVFHEKDGSSVTLDIGSAKGSMANYATISTHPGAVFLISSYTATRIGKKPADLSKDATATAAAGAAPPGGLPPGLMMPHKG